MNWVVWPNKIWNMWILYTILIFYMSQTWTDINVIWVICMLAIYIYDFLVLLDTVSDLDERNNYRKPRSWLVNLWFYVDFLGKKKYRVDPCVPLGLYESHQDGCRLQVNPPMFMDTYTTEWSISFCWLYNISDCFPLYPHRSILHWWNQLNS